MDLSSINPILLLASLMVSATPILLAAIGEVVVERSGVLNLGVEGLMITGAVIGFAVAVNTSSPGIGFICAALAAALLSLSFAVLTQIFLSNQVATGLGLTLVGLGLSALIGKPYEGMKSPSLDKLDLPLLSDLPVLGPLCRLHLPHLKHPACTKCCCALAGPPLNLNFQPLDHQGKHAKNMCFCILSGPWKHA